MEKKFQVSVSEEMTPPDLKRGTVSKVEKGNLDREKGEQKYRVKRTQLVWEAQTTL